jgi:hypothetical protein
MSPPIRALPTEPDIALYQGNLKDLTPEQKQVANQVKQAIRLYEEWLLTDELYKETIKGYLNYTTEKKPEEKPIAKDKSKGDGTN